MHDWPVLKEQCSCTMISVNTGGIRANHLMLFSPMALHTIEHVSGHACLACDKATGLCAMNDATEWYNLGVIKANHLMLLSCMALHTSSYA